MGQLWGFNNCTYKQHTYKLFCDKQCETEDSLTYGMNAMVNLVAKQTQEIHFLSQQIYKLVHGQNLGH